MTLMKAHGRRVRIVLLVALATGALFAIQGMLAPSAQAHQWGCWHWHRSSPAYVYNYNQSSSTSFNSIEAARSDIHARPHPVYLYGLNYHTDLSSLDGYFGFTGWVGLAQIMNYSGCHILHAHATMNLSYVPYGYNIQGTMCQELAHGLGLDHSDTGDCMGLGYYPGSSGRICFGTACDHAYSHQAADLQYMYGVLR
jgi:hypothetical protein